MDVPAFIKSALVMTISAGTLVWQKITAPAKRNNVTKEQNDLFIISISFKK